MSRLDFCQYELVDDCYDWKNDNCDECNIFKAYCEGARRAKNSIVRCKDCKWYEQKQKNLPYNVSKRYCNRSCVLATKENDFCSYGEGREE